MSFLGRVLDETMSCETMALRVTEKVNSRLKFLYRVNQFFDDLISQTILCNNLIKPHFDYTCTAWDQNLTKTTKRYDASYTNQIH